MKIGRIFEYIRIFVQFSIRIFIRTFVRVKFFIRIYSDIHSCKFFDTNIFGYSFVSKFLRMSHSASQQLSVECGSKSKQLTTYSKVKLKGVCILIIICVSFRNHIFLKLCLNLLLSTLILFLQSNLSENMLPGC